MKLYYNSTKKQFYINENAIVTVPFGRNSFLLSKKIGASDTEFILDSTQRLDHIPLIGILASKKASGVYKGNFKLFTTIQEHLQTKGAFSFVFAPDDVHVDGVEGICFNKESGKWLKCFFPLPSLIYNRVPSRQDEASDLYQRFFNDIKEKGTPFFNPHFFHKWEIHNVLKKSKTLLPLLPETEQITDKERFVDFLQQHKKIYVKPSLSSQGKGIRLIELDNSGKICCKSTRKIEKYSSIERFLSNYSSWFDEGEWIIQKSIECETHKGSRFDYRVLVQHSGETYKITGVGIRLSQRQDVTTHVPAGGKIISINEVSSKGLNTDLQAISEECGRILSKDFGYIGEFSIDLAPRVEGGFVLFEVNSKPMSFDEQTIEEKRVKQLIQTFLHLSNQNLKG